MGASKAEKPDRRQFLGTAGAATLAAGLSPLALPARASSGHKTLRIMRWKNFVPAFETWFNDVFVTQWGEKNDTTVVVDNVGLGEIGKLATAEIEAGEGHDLVLFLSPRPSLEDHVIDHRGVFEECETRFGPAYAFARKSSFNPKTGKFHGFCESYAPTVVTYRKDLWDAVGAVPDTWDSIRRAGRAVKLLHNAPVGISLAPEHNAEHSWRAVLAAFGASVQDVDGRLALASKHTLDALEFAKALYDETMSPAVLNWRPPSNNQEMLSGGTSLTIDTMSIIRAAENKRLPVEPDLALAPLPEGPAGRIGPAFAANTYVVWKFAENPDGAQQFLVDYVAAFRDGLLASGFQSMPSFAGSVPDLADIIAAQPGVAGRYDLLTSLPETLTNLGHPGHSNAATDEVRDLRIVSAMFAQAVTGQLSAGDAMAQAAAAAGPVFDKWRQAGKI